MISTFNIEDDLPPASLLPWHRLAAFSLSAILPVSI